MTEAMTLPIPVWTLGDRLRKARVTAGLSVDAMADLLDVSRNTISNYEAERSHPRRATLIVWAQETGVPLSWLTGPPLDSPRYLALQMTAA